MSALLASDSLDVVKVLRGVSAHLSWEQEIFLEDYKDFICRFFFSKILLPRTLNVDAHTLATNSSFFDIG